MSAKQRAEIRDRVVTSDEYHAAFDRYRECLADAGYKVVIAPDFNGILQYSIPTEAIEAGVDDPCYAREFDKVDLMWQLAHEDTSYSAQVIRNCVIANDLPPHDKMADNISELKNADINLDTCAGS